MAKVCACRSSCGNSSLIFKNELAGATPTESSDTSTPTPTLSRASISYSTIAIVKTYACSCPQALIDNSDFYAFTFFSAYSKYLFRSSLQCEQFTEPLKKLKEFQIICSDFCILIVNISSTHLLAPLLQLVLLPKNHFNSSWKLSFSLCQASSTTL